MMFKLIVLFVVISEIATGTLVWVLKETPAIFGKDVQLVCSLPHDISCCREYNRKWNVGWKNTLTVMNNKSVNETKYSEELDETSHTSILIIKSFSVDDVNIPYECVYGFMKYGATLMMNEDEYEFRPNEQLPVEPGINRNDISLKVTFESVYPKPSCLAMIGVRNITSELTVTSTSHNLFYKSTIQLHYMTSQNDCTQHVFVTCLVGETVLMVANFIPCSTHEDSTLLIIGIIFVNRIIISKWIGIGIGIGIGISIGISIVIGILILVISCLRKRKKNHDGMRNKTDENEPCVSPQLKKKHFRD